METYINAGGATTDGSIDVGSESYDIPAGSDLHTLLQTYDSDLEGLNVTVKTNNAGEAVSLTAVELAAGTTYNFGFIDALVDFDGITIEGDASVETDKTGDGGADNTITVSGDNVTLRYFTIDDNLTVNGNDFTSKENHITGDVDVNGEDASFNTEIGGDVTVDGTGASFSNVTVTGSVTVSAAGATFTDATINTNFIVDAGISAKVSGATKVTGTVTVNGTLDASEADEQELKDAADEANTAAEETAVANAITALQDADWSAVAEGSNLLTLAEEIVDNDDVTVELSNTDDEEVIDEDGNAVGADTEEIDVTFEVTVGGTTDTTEAITVTLTAGESEQAAIDAVNEATNVAELLLALNDGPFTSVDSDLIEEYDTAFDLAGVDTDTIGKIQAAIDAVNDLEAAKADADLTAADYAATSWTALTDALDLAETTVEEMNTKTTAIQAAIDALVDISELTALIDTAEGLSEEDYTAESWTEANLTTADEGAIAVATVVADDAEATQTEVDDAVTDLQAAIDKLVEKEA